MSERASERRRARAPSSSSYACVAADWSNSFLRKLFFFLIFVSPPNYIARFSLRALRSRFSKGRRGRTHVEIHMRARTPHVKKMKNVNHTMWFAQRVSESAKEERKNQAPAGVGACTAGTVVCPGCPKSMKLMVNLGSLSGGRASTPPQSSVPGRAYIFPRYTPG